MELQLELTLSRNSILSNSSLVHESSNVLNYSVYTSFKEEIAKMNKKRPYDDEEVNSNDHVLPQTFPFFVSKSNGEDERDQSLDKKLIHFNKNEEDKNVIVGWPPIKSWRKRVCHVINNTRNYVIVENNGRRRGSRRERGRINPNNSGSMFVKVKMEGLGIGRKVDLSQHQCFQTLTHTLLSMFGKCEQQNMQTYKLTYQDKRGDWLLAEDVTWGSFLGSVQRLKLMKK